MPFRKKLVHDTDLSAALFKQPSRPLDWQQHRIRRTNTQPGCQTGGFIYRNSRCSAVLQSVTVPLPQYALLKIRERYQRSIPLYSCVKQPCRREPILKQMTPSGASSRYFCSSCCKTVIFKHCFLVNETTSCNVLLIFEVLYFCAYSYKQILNTNSKLNIQVKFHLCHESTKEVRSVDPNYNIRIYLMTLKHEIFLRSLTRY